MKYRWIFVLAITAALVLSVFVSGMEPEHNRYHQHLEAVEKAPCTDHGEDVFCTHLPLMEITTDGPVPEPFVNATDNTWSSSKVRNYETVAASVRYFDNETENNHLTDDPVVKERALFRTRGASSRSFDKKSYLLKFTEKDMTTSLDVSLSGMTADNNWALHGPFLDKSLIRNYLCYNLAGEIMDYAPNCRFCELFVNEEYLGLYLLTEKIGYNENGRINVTETDPQLATTSYILQVDRGATDPRYNLETYGANSYLTRGKMHANQGHLEILYPGKTLTQAQHDYITLDFSRFEKTLFSYDYNDPDKGWRRYIDAQSFIDFFLINEFTLNYDAPGLSTYLYKDVSGKLKMCVWDFDAAFDYYRYSESPPESFRIQNALWFRFLFKDETFVDQVVKRYRSLRKRFINEEYIFQYIDDTVDYLGPAIERNYKKWGKVFDDTYNLVQNEFLKAAEPDVRDYAEEIEQIKETLATRMEYMDSNLDRLYSLCHESMNKRYNHMTEAGGA